MLTYIERRRAVYCILLMDTQLSAFWNQHVSRQLSIFAHHVALPCPRSQWDALTATDWFRARETATVAGNSNANANANVNTTSSPSTNNKTTSAAGGVTLINHPPTNNASINTTPTSTSKTRSGYLPGLHPEFQVGHVPQGYSSAILSAFAADGNFNKVPFKVDMDNVLTVEMILMGIMAIAWDCRTRGGMGFRMKEGLKHWRSVVHNCESYSESCRHQCSLEVTKPSRITHKL